jgi:3(or 17)beta-hydroxysteroid dehydrogenase
MGRIEQKVCVITGGSQGIGAATARLLAREGAMVLITDLKHQEGEAVATSIRGTGGVASFVHHDVTNETDWQHVFENAVSEFGCVDVLVNNAGVAERSPPEDQTLERWRWCRLNELSRSQDR